MVDGKGKLSYSEFVEIEPKSGTDTEGNRNSKIEFLVSGSVGSDFELSGDYCIVGINIPYKTFSNNGSIQNNKPALAALERIVLTGVEPNKSIVFQVISRKLRGTYASFLVQPRSLSSLIGEFSNPDPSNPFWNDTSSIHFEYYFTSSQGNESSINFIPDTTVKVYIDEYDVTIGMAQGLRGSKFVMPVKSDLDTVSLRVSSSFIITGSVADSYFSDSGIASGHFYGSKCVGQYLSKEIPGLVSASFVIRKEELKEIGTQRDPAFMYLTGFSGSIIKDEYTDKDVEAGTITFEELKFSRYRVSGSKDYFESTQSYLQVSGSGSDAPVVPVTGSFKAPYENMVCDFGDNPSLNTVLNLRRCHQKQYQYFELFSTGSVIPAGQASESYYTLFTSSRSILSMWPVPPTHPGGIIPLYRTERLCNIGSLKLPELCDIIYRNVSGSNTYARVYSSMFYVAESNAIYRTDRFGRVYQIDILDNTGSLEPSGSGE